MAKDQYHDTTLRLLGKQLRQPGKGAKESRKKVCDEMYISPRYLANIENKGQHPSLQIFFELPQSSSLKLIFALKVYLLPCSLSDLTFTNFII